MRHPVAAPSAAPRRPRARAIRAALGLAVLVTSACARSAAMAASDADSTTVTVVAHPVAFATRAWSTTASGIVHANTTVDIAFQVPGKVLTAGPDEGQAVRAGQVIATLDPLEYQLAVAQAVAHADRAVGDRDRNRPLLAAGSVSAADMEHLESGARQATAAADLARKRLADTRLAAPISGVVARRGIEVGATASPGQPAYTIVALDPVRVRVGVPEADVGHITEGAKAIVRIPALDASVEGRVSLIGVVADPVTRSYAVEVTVPNPARRLRAGMVADATISSPETTLALMVPSAAVLHDGSAGALTIVYVLDPDGARAHARRVTLGAARGDSLEITSGLTAGDRVVVAGQQRLRDGARVQPAAVPAQATTMMGGSRP